MARERKRVMGELAAYQIAWTVKAFSGVVLDVDAINPYRVRQQPRKKTEAEIQRESELGWRLLDHYFLGKRTA